MNRQVKGALASAIICLVLPVTCNGELQMSCNTTLNIKEYLCRAWDRNLYETFAAIPTLIDESYYADISNRKCLGDLKTIVSGLSSFDSSAIQFVDSWGKPSSGILEGNLNQYGNFDQCLNSHMDTHLKGKYCLISINFHLPNSLKKLNTLIHSHYAIKNNQNDPVHRIPHYSTFNWGTCIPMSCSSQDLQIGLTSVLKHLLPNNVTFEIKSSDSMCYYNQPNWKMRTETVWSSIYFLCLVLLCLFGSLKMFSKQINSYGYRQLSDCFSIRRNLDIITDRSICKKEYLSVHGIRVLSAIGLLLSHKHMAMLYNPYMNRTSMARTIGLPWSVIGRTAIIYTDGFILISGFLTANSIIKELSKTGKIKIAQTIMLRVSRLLPNMVTVIVFCTWILPNLGSGPLWPQVITKHSELCKQSWWKNIMFIHNYYGFENMCLTHTHQLGIDFQLFLLSIPIVFIVWHNKKIGYAIIIFVAIYSTLLRLFITYINNLSVVIYHGIEVSQLFKTANLSYIMPSHRSTVYLMGIALSFYFQNKSPCKFPKIYVTLGWLIASSCGLLAMLGPFHMSSPEYKYDAIEAAVYSASSPIMWGVLISWAIVATEHGYGGWLGKLLSWQWFKVASKLTYSVYLVQFPVFFYNVGIQKNISYYSPWELFPVGEYLTIIAASTFLTLLVEIPINRIFKLRWSNAKKSDLKVSMKTGEENEISEHNKLSNPKVYIRRRTNIG